ncbi:hypothetical protein RND81_08G057900 [Saponaria officinalis]|uniref:Retrotransposon gag domain-containing protein n=1 Tax=Saponaria officinalis TaxID=3572 RepID=A0AAW1J482_SAPOF
MSGVETNVGAEKAKSTKATNEARFGKLESEMGACREILTEVLNRLTVLEEEKPNEGNDQTMDMINNLTSIVEELKIEVAELRIRRIRDSPSPETPKIKVPEPPKYSGERDSKEIDNFLWSIEHYFSNRRRETDIQRGTCTITTWEEFKTDFKKQFYPENATEVALKKLRNLRQTGTIRDYVKQFFTLSLEIVDMPESMSLFYFMDGLKRGAEQELKRRDVKTLSDAIACAESLYEGPSETTDRITRNDNGYKGRSGGRYTSQNTKPNTWKTSESKEQYKNKPKEKSYSRGDAKCFLCEGSHFIRDCPTRHKINAMTKAYIPDPEESKGALTKAYESDDGQSDGEAKIGALRLLNNMSKGDDGRPARKDDLMFVEVLVNGTPSIAMFDSGATHNFVTKNEATRLGIKYEHESGDLKAVNSASMPIHGVAHVVPLQLKNWKGTVDFTIVTMDDHSVILGLEFIRAVAPITVEKDGAVTIKGRMQVEGNVTQPTRRQEVGTRIVKLDEMQVGGDVTQPTQEQNDEQVPIQETSIEIREEMIQPGSLADMSRQEDRPLELILEPTRVKKKNPSKRDKEPKRKKGRNKDDFECKDAHRSQNYPLNQPRGRENMLKPIKNRSTREGICVNPMEFRISIQGPRSNVRVWVDKTNDRPREDVAVKKTKSKVISTNMVTSKCEVDEDVNHSSGGGYHGPLIFKHHMRTTEDCGHSYEVEVSSKLAHTSSSQAHSSIGSSILVDVAHPRSVLAPNAKRHVQGGRFIPLRLITTLRHLV